MTGGGRQAQKIREEYEKANFDFEWGPCTFGISVRKGPLVAELTIVLTFETSTFALSANECETFEVEIRFLFNFQRFLLHLRSELLSQCHILRETFRISQSREVDLRESQSVEELLDGDFDLLAVDRVL